MPNKNQPFRQHHVTRAVRGAGCGGGGHVEPPGGGPPDCRRGDDCGCWWQAENQSAATATFAWEVIVTPKAKPKKPSAQHGKTYGEGGADKMFKPQAAGPVKAGQMGKSQTAAPGAKGPTGGTAKFG